MGVYDYRPYVKRVTNDRQVVYECDKGYILEGGPVGATCVDGRWSPQKLPRSVQRCWLVKHNMRNLVFSLLRELNDVHVLLDVLWRDTHR